MIKIAPLPIVPKGDLKAAFRPSALPSHVMSVYVDEEGDSTPRSASGESNDSILPEYRINARKLNAKELKMIKKYHKDNLKKFSVDVDADSEKDIDQKKISVGLKKD